MAASSRPNVPPSRPSSPAIAVRTSRPIRAAERARQERRARPLGYDLLAKMLKLGRELRWQLQGVKSPVKLGGSERVRFDSRFDTCSPVTLGGSERVRCDSRFWQQPDRPTPRPPKPVSLRRPPPASTPVPLTAPAAKSCAYPHRRPARAERVYGLGLPSATAPHPGIPGMPACRLHFAHADAWADQELANRGHLVAGFSAYYWPA
jgi:hypothetical protein